MGGAWILSSSQPFKMVCVCDVITWSALVATRLASIIVSQVSVHWNVCQVRIWRTFVSFIRMVSLSMFVLVPGFRTWIGFVAVLFS